MLVRPALTASCPNAEVNQQINMNTGVRHLSYRLPLGWLKRKECTRDIKVRIGPKRPQTKSGVRLSTAPGQKRLRPSSARHVCRPFADGSASPVGVFPEVQSTAPGCPDGRRYGIGYRKCGKSDFEGGGGKRGERGAAAQMFFIAYIVGPNIERPRNPAVKDGGSGLTVKKNSSQKNPEGSSTWTLLLKITFSFALSWHYQ